MYARARRTALPVALPVALLALLALLALATAAPLAAQSDTFNGGTTEGWFAGGGPLGQFPPVPPAQIPDGGPGGTGDGFLQITSGGGDGAGSRLVAMNGAQWARNYLDDGIVGIRMQVRNFGTSDLFLRLLFENPIPGPPTDIAVSTEAFTLPAMSGWMPIFFSIRPGALTALQGTVSAALSTTTIIRLYHSPELVFPPPAIAGQLGVDDITATTIPEPSTVVLLASGLAALAGAARRRRGGRADG